MEDAYLYKTLHYATIKKTSISLKSEISKL